MNIILIGFMGSGKSAVGHLLANQLKMDYLDADELIEKTEKMPINDIFAKKGEPYFRELESQVIKTLQDYDNFVISTGGGMVLRQENVKLLKEVGPLVLLWAEPNVIYQRIKNEKHRPLLKVKVPRAEIYKILEQRESIYRQAADFEVDTCKLSVEEVSSKIITWLKSK
ncbi:MAG: shikimate kinase [Candidatus Margulisbacteria bacterium]|nr:shikimate kinase [Candidatus Margulisiibacteriota bacterium]